MRTSYQLSANVDHPLRADALKYMTIATNLVDYGTYSHDLTPPPRPNNFITPGYPLFLASIYALTGSVPATYYSVLLLQAILGSLSVVITFLIGRAFMPLYAALLAAVAAVFSPHLIVIGGYLLTETLFSFLLLSSLYLLVLGIQKNRSLFYILSGVLVGLAALVRPVILLLPLFFVLIWYLSATGKQLLSKHSLPALIMAAFLVWLPWQIWSSRMPDTNQSNARATFILGTYPDFTYQSEQFRGFPTREDPQFKTMSQSWSSAIDITLERARQDPARYLHWYLVGKPLALWDWSMIQGQGGPFIYPVTSSLYNRDSLHAFSYAALHLARPYILVLAALCVLSLIVSEIVRKGNGHDTADFIGLNIVAPVVYVSIVHSLLAADARYVVPFYSLVYLAAAYAIVRISSLKHTYLKRTRNA